MIKPFSIDLSVDVGGLKLRNPVMPASGTFAEGLDKVIDFNRLGAFVTKTVTRELRAGNPLPRVVERPGSLINAIGIPSKGVPHFIEKIIPQYAAYEPPLVVSISAPTAEGFGGGKGSNTDGFGFNGPGVVPLRLRSGIADGGTFMFLNPTAEATGA